MLERLRINVKKSLAFVLAESATYGKNLRRVENK
jgi:hypothetical protein